MLLLRGATGLRDKKNFAVCFNTCSSCEEQLSGLGTRCSVPCFNTCSSCEEQQGYPYVFEGTQGFNTCSSCEEQHSRMYGAGLAHGFQYMLLLRGATLSFRLPSSWRRVSIHAPLARSNCLCLQPFSSVVGFNTCSSCEEQPSDGSAGASATGFQYMLLLRGATLQKLSGGPACRSFNTCSSCEEQQG